MAAADPALTVRRRFARPDPVHVRALTGVPVGQDTVLVIPWLQLAVVGVLVPLVAGAIAWAGIRKAPQVTRRST